MDGSFICGALKECPGVSPGEHRRPAAAAVGSLLGLAMLLTACGTAQQAERAGTEKLFRTVYQDIAEVYLERIELQDLALVGLSTLKSHEPGLDVRRQGEKILVSVPGAEAVGFVAPPREDAEAWGKLMTAAMETGRRRSEKLQAVAWSEINDAVLESMFEELDGRSYYRGPNELLELQGKKSGFDATIGVALRTAHDGARIIGVTEAGPADAVGLTDGDHIWRIDGTPVAGLDKRGLYELLRGDPGTEVELTITRVGRNVVETVTITRAVVESRPVRYRLLGDIAYLRLMNFGSATLGAVADGLRQAEDDLGRPLEGAILDLRNSPGGLLDIAVLVADLFVTDGLLVSVDGRHPDSLQYFAATPDDLLDGRPLVVLINGMTSGGASIVAAALQDSGRAVVLGSASSGHGTIQTVLRLPNGGQIALTWALYYASSGYAIAGRGVLPDLCTAGPGVDSDSVLQRLRRGSLPIDKWTQRRSVDYRDEAAVAAFRAVCPPSYDVPDVDLDLAKRLLKEPALYSLALGLSQSAELKGLPFLRD